ncbi:MAG: DUF58 domain-containing protein [Planctomycetes bacterium]|nr:DUF58 domain-containing protein [Planctomycetota bacterium]
MKRVRALPVVPERFPAGFRTMLRDLLARGPKLRTGRTEQRRAQSRALAQSGTFVGHRPYVCGDDLRRIDWAACARTGELFVKLLEEEDRRTLTILLDLSASLLAGTPPRRLAALRLAAVLGGLALRRLDGLTIVAPGAGRAEAATFAGAGDLDELLRHLDALPVADVAPDAAIATFARRGVAGRIHWISDFAEPRAFEVPLAALRRRGADVVGWLPTMPEDHGAPRRGYVEVIDPENGASLAVPVDDELAAAMQRELELLARRQARLFAQTGCPLVRWASPEATDFRAAVWQDAIGWGLR